MKNKYGISRSSGLDVRRRIFLTGVLNINTALLLGSTVIPITTYAASENDTIAFSIPSGDLQKGLLAIAEQSKQTISFNPALVVNYQSAALTGNYSTRQAILRLLQSTPLLLTTTNNGTLTIITSQSDNADVANANSKTLPSITVSATGDDGFLSSSTTTTRSGAPLRTTPQTINVVNSNVMEKQSARNVTDALRNISSVTVLPGSLGSSTVQIRGYQSNVLIDGLNVSGSSPLNLPAIALDSVEVIKGPSAMLNGAGSNGGIVNLVRKKPQAKPAHEIKLGYGSYNERRLEIDSTGALTDDGRLSYRLIAAGAQSDDSAAHYDGKKESYFSPTLGWKDDTTDFQLGFTRNIQTTPFMPYTLMYRGKPWTGDLPKPLGNKNDQFKLRQSVYYYNLEQTLSDQWTWVSKASYENSESWQYGWYNAYPLNDDMTTYLNSFAQGGHYRSLNTENYLRAEYHWDDVKSTTVLGVSATRQNNTSFPTYWSNNWTLISIREPLPNLPFAKNAHTKAWSEQRPLGGFVSQNIDYDRWHLATGLRYDSSWHGVFNHGEANANEREEVWSPSVGLLYEITPWVAIYGSHQKGYQPSNYFDKNGALLPAPITSQNEFGLKFDLLDSRLSVTTSAYRIQYKNSVYFDNNEGGYAISPNKGSLRGIELDIQGNVLPGLNVIGNYNLLKSNVGAGATKRLGNPQQRASLWLDYDFQSPLLEGFSTGLGMIYSSAIYSVNAGKNYTVPSQLETDVRVGYSYRNYSLDLTVKNIFDEDLYVGTPSGQPQFVPLLQPRSFLLTASYKF
ncbi:TonB-dependent siderophore receptor [Pectobacterium araliae]|uniref:TonB-dependent siderophore receptor n=1 Tax=Pectobacterium araliae TaxID=3073862 RepID=A0AAN0K9J3_9GAMM|nr:TonB-dependent siderophore receptor [Pectobacterium sp. MAFF 302110]